MDEVQKLEEQLKRLEEPMIEALQAILRIPSVIEEEVPGCPFGRPIDQVLKKTLELCETLGFRTYYDPEGYYGYAEIGEGVEMIGILGHLDVVPSGHPEAWIYPPFDSVIQDGKLYGRGSQDDKGPTIASLFAAKALIDAQIELPKRVRFIFGTDEETHWRCMKKYVENEEMPSLGFTPDSKFPLIYAEKELLQVHLEARNETPLRLEGGTSVNTVPDRMVYEGERQADLTEKLNELGFDYQSREHGVEVLGKAVHAQFTEQGINAICRLSIALHEIGIDSKVIQFIAEKVKEDPHATSIFGPCEDAISGKLNFNIGKMSITKEKERLFLDLRLPVTVNKQRILEQLSEAVQPYGLTLVQEGGLPAIYLSKDHVLIRTLMGVYQEVTGDFESQPISSGGATYARAINNCVAFGAIFPHREKLAHQPNESIELKDLFLAMEIYAKAIYRLTRS